jgi:hypothetical protein
LPNEPLHQLLTQAIQQSQGGIQNLLTKIQAQFSQETSQLDLLVQQTEQLQAQLHQKLVDQEKREI